MMRAIIMHDTKRVIEVTPDVCTLLRCEPEDLIDNDVTNGAAGEDIKALMRFRLGVLRERGYTPPAVLPLKRIDGSQFWAAVDTQVNAQGLYETSIIYIRDLKSGERVPYDL